VLRIRGRKRERRGFFYCAGFGVTIGRTKKQQQFLFLYEKEWKYKIKIKRMGRLYAVGRYII